VLIITGGRDRPVLAAAIAAGFRWRDGGPGEVRPLRLTICHAFRMTVQIAVKLDDALAEQVKAAAADAGTNLSEWVRAALQREALLAKSRRARAEEDAREAVYTEEREAALMTARRRRALVALDER